MREIMNSFKTGDWILLGGALAGTVFLSGALFQSIVERVRRKRVMSNMDSKSHQKAALVLQSYAQTYRDRSHQLRLSGIEEQRREAETCRQIANDLQKRADELKER